MPLFDDVVFPSTLCRTAWPLGTPRVHTLARLRYDGSDKFAELLDDDSMRARNCLQQILGSHRW
jgi:hypothetical protein